ncbi:MAG: ribokinase [Pseudomonadota bacterium]|nr:ribokinase [Pseudomonadota bacterium]
MLAHDARVVVVGSFNVDHVWTATRLPSGGETLHGTYASGPGGKGFNQAMAAARAGAATTFLCALGEDAGGQLARALATAENIALHDAHSDMPTGTAGIFVDADGRNSIVIGAGANAALSREFVAGQRGAIIAAGVVVTQLESPIDAVKQALQLARDARCLTLLNPAPANADTTPALLALANILTPNESEFAALLERHCDARIQAEQIAAMDDAELHTLCRQLLPHGSVIVTLGAGGVFVSHPDSQQRGDAATWYRVPAEAVDVVDTTGAGDAFNGALAASLANRQGTAFDEHVRFANRYAAMSTERKGAALSMPLIGEVQQRFRST